MILLKNKRFVRLHHFRLELQNDLRNSQVDHMLTSANRKLFDLRQLKKFGVRDPELVTIYKGYVRPVLEYSVPVWHISLTANQVKRHESVQKRVCKIIDGQRSKLL